MSFEADSPRHSAELEVGVHHPIPFKEMVHLAVVNSEKQTASRIFIQRFVLEHFNVPHSKRTSNHIKNALRKLVEDGRIVKKKGSFLRKLNMPVKVAKPVKVVLLRKNADGKEELVLTTDKELDGLQRTRHNSYISVNQHGSTKSPDSTGRITRSMAQKVPPQC